MKTTLILAILLICASNLTFAGKSKRSSVHPTSKIVNLSSPFYKVSVGENLKVVFSNEVNTNATVEGQPEFVNGINLEIVEGTLYVSAKGNSAYHKGTIFIPVKLIQEIDLKMNASASNKNILRSPFLKVSLCSGSKANLKNLGNIKIISEDGSEINYEKNESISWDN